MIETLFNCFFDPYNDKTIAEVEYVDHFEFTRPNGEEDTGTGFIVWLSNGHCIKALLSDNDKDDDKDDNILDKYKDNRHHKHGIFLLSSSDTSIVGRQVDYAAWESELDPTCTNLLSGNMTDHDMLISSVSGSGRNDIRFAIVGIALGDGTGVQVVAFNHSKDSHTMYFDYEGIREVKNLS